MATRATYCIEVINHLPITYYCHWDGYLEGAARYFFNMQQAKAKRDNLAARFLIGNSEYAEFTHNHDSHGDTEFKYTIDRNGVLTAYKLSNWEKREFTIMFIGPYEQFISTYLPKNIED